MPRSSYKHSFTGGVEVFAGVSRDPDFGLSLAFGMGGIAIEVMRDFALRMLPLREGDAEAMIAETRGAALLNSIRGGEAADIESLTRCLYALADFASQNAGHIAEMDLNLMNFHAEGQRLHCRRRADRDAAGANKFYAASATISQVCVTRSGSNSSPLRSYPATCRMPRAGHIATASRV